MFKKGLFSCRWRLGWVVLDMGRVLVVFVIVIFNIRLLIGLMKEMFCLCFKDGEVV